MPTATTTATKPVPAAVPAAAAAAAAPKIANRPEYSPLGFKLFYHDDPNFVMTNEYINRILYGEP
jgi:hypothetical protein